MKLGVLIGLTLFSIRAFPADLVCEKALRISNAQKAVEEIFAQAHIELSDQGSPDVLVHDPRFYRDFLTDPELAFGETYMDGQWDSPAIDQVTAKILSTQRRVGRLNQIAPMWRTPGLAALSLLRNGYRHLRDGLTNRQTRARSKTVAKEHYDAGNELYRLMLDPTMTYTSGIWDEGYTLEDAQNAKYDLIARKLGLKTGQKVLDIGCGFGGFARFAAKYYGANVTGITISVEQLKAARAISAGQTNVDFIFSDYRDLPYRFAAGHFDHVVSIEMIEAVGQKNLAPYFAAAAHVLKPGGRFVIQAISSPGDVVNSNAWFSKYIFQDGVAVSTNQISKAAKKYFGAPADTHAITAHYDNTLMAWHANFTRAWPRLKDRYSERFKRMWDFYLLSVAGAFRVDYTQVNQIVFVKGESEVEAIRELPSRARLTEMRASDAEVERLELAIGDLEARKVESPRPREEKPRAPLAKSARIAIVGAGPSGLSSALELKRMGYDHVTVFEKADEVGGKSHTVNIGGRLHDLGATMGVRGKYARVIALAKRTGQKTIPFPEEINYDLNAGGPAAPASLRENARFAYQGLLYLINYAKLSLRTPRALEIPPSELADPWSVVTKRQGAGEFGARLNTYIQGYGYGDETTPALYPMRMLDPGAIIGAALAKSVMWENGTQAIWKGVANELHVRTGTEVDRIERDSSGVNVFVRGEAEPRRFDKLILAVDPDRALAILDATREERSVFSHVRYTPYATFAVRVAGHAEGRTEVGYLKENMATGREGHPMAWIKRHADDDICIFHLFAPAHISDEQILANIGAAMKKLGARDVTLEDSRRWPFFPHVDAIAMREGRFFERAWSLQGQNHTVFANEALGMSTMPDAAELGVNVAKRLVSGEY